MSLCVPEILGRLARRESIPVPAALVAAHPDDEVIGAGASLRLFPRLLLVHVTDGAPLNLADAHSHGFATAAEYAAARREELAAALRVGGASPETAELGASDQGVSLRLAELARALAARLRRHGAELVITHPYEGGHPDHDAAAFITRAACRLLAREGVDAGVPVPAILEMTSYHAGPEGGLESGCFLPDGPAPVVVALTPAERATKRAMLDAFATQRSTLAQFGDAAEAFRSAPTYDFAAPPHPGQVHYERHDWGITGAAWREKAAAAWRELGLES